MSTSPRKSEAMPVVKFPEKSSVATTASSIAAILFMGIVIRFGWLSDDAFVSFRALGNLVTGNGLLSNPGERVQAFTNPLWTLLLAPPYWLTDDIYAAAILVSLLCCLAHGHLHLAAAPGRLADGLDAAPALHLVRLRELLDERPGERAGPPAAGALLPTSVKDPVPAGGSGCSARSSS